MTNQSSQVHFSDSQYKRLEKFSQVIVMLMIKTPDINHLQQSLRIRRQ